MNSAALQVDGKILIGGEFSYYNATFQMRVAGLNTDGSLDTSFGGGVNNSVKSVAVQGDGKILICGDYNGTPPGYVARLNADGMEDLSFFHSGAGASSTVSSMAVQGDGKILIGGDFDRYNGTAQGYVARLNTDGSLDTSFLATGAGANGGVSSVAVEGDGKILIGGSFTAYNGTARGSIARLNTDGSLDTSFLATGAGANGYVYSVVVQGDGKILIGGSFTAYNGTARGSIARLNNDGSLDTSFLATGVGASVSVTSVAVQGDGKILIGGYFGAYNGTSRGRVARLNTDGSLDTTFLAAGNGVNLWVFSVAVQADGKILLGGDFTEYWVNDMGSPMTPRAHVARLLN